MLRNGAGSIWRRPFKSIHTSLPESLLCTVLTSSATSLTSLNLDWMNGMDGHFKTLWSNMPTFPHLKAVQLRNLLTSETQIFWERVVSNGPG